jgi:hypothetical protein
MTLNPLDWRPHPGQQERFLQCIADEALFGGAAGPGKTECLLMEGLRQIAHPGYRAIFFRRTFPKLEAANGPIDRSLQIFPSLGGKYNGSKHYWEFPSGARYYFGHMQHENDKQRYQGAEFHYVVFDELTEFTEGQYLYMFTRTRAPKDSGLIAYARNGTNPGNEGHAWVKKRFITRGIVNQARYFAQIKNEKGDMVDTQVSADYQDAKGRSIARSRAFFPALLSDNPTADPDYEARILATGDEVMIARFLEGDWDAAYMEGLIYPNWSSDNITDGAEYNPDLPVYWAIDDGYVYGDGPGSATYHPRVILFLQDNAIGGLNIFDELVVTGESSFDSTIGQALSMPYKRPSVAYIDGSAAAFRGAIHGHGISTINGTHKVVEGIKSMRQLICDGNGVRRLLVHPRCQKVIYEMTEYRSNQKGMAKTGEIVPLKVDDHTMDAARYIIYKRRRNL